MYSVLKTKFGLEKSDTKYDPQKYFFGNVLSETTSLDSLDEYSFHNFSGEHSLSNDKHCQYLLRYIMDNGLLKSGDTHCDFGASRGKLFSELLKLGVNSYGIDGCSYGIKNNQLDIDPSKYAVCDLSEDLSVFDFEKQFKLITAFEFLEHLTEEQLFKVLGNVKYMGKYLLASLHFGGKEEANHYLVRPITWWKEILSNYGTVSILETLSIPTFTESKVALVELL